MEWLLSRNKSYQFRTVSLESYCSISRDTMKHKEESSDGDDEIGKFNRVEPISINGYGEDHTL